MKRFGKISLRISLLCAFLFLFAPDVYDSFAMIAISVFFSFFALYGLLLGFGGLYCTKCDKLIWNIELIDSITTDTTPNKKDGTNDLRYTETSNTERTFKYTCKCGHSSNSSINTPI